MTIIVPSVSEKDLLEFMTGKATPTSWVLRLFVNNITPDDNTVLANLTEMTTNGYVTKALANANFIAVAGAVSFPATSTYNAALTWTFTASGGSNVVYGYYVTEVGNGRLQWIELFPTPKTVANAGDQIIITPTITLSRV